MAGSFEKFPPFWLGRAVGELVACSYITAMRYDGPSARITMSNGLIGVIDEPVDDAFTWTLLDPEMPTVLGTGTWRCTDDPAIDGRNIWHAMSRVTPLIV